jgi:hypothetical protein
MIRIVEAATGRIAAHASNSAEEVEETLQAGMVMFKCDERVSGLSHYVSDMSTGALTEIPATPGTSYSWNWTSKVWEVKADAVARLQRYAAGALNKEFATRDQSPISLDGASYDADATARKNIDGVINGIDRVGSLPTGWVGWRDADNVMRHTALDMEDVRAFLVALDKLIIDRTQALYVLCWTKKANVMTLSFEDLLAFDATAGWS